MLETLCSNNRKYNLIFRSPTELNTYIRFAFYRVTLLQSEEYATIVLFVHLQPIITLAKKTAEDN